MLKSTGNIMCRIIMLYYLLIIVPIFITNTWLQLRSLLDLFIFFFYLFFIYVFYRRNAGWQTQFKFYYQCWVCYDMAIHCSIRLKKNIFNYFQIFPSEVPINKRKRIFIFCWFFHAWLTFGKFTWLFAIIKHKSVKKSLTIPRLLI